MLVIVITRVFKRITSFTHSVVRIPDTEVDPRYCKEIVKKEEKDFYLQFPQAEKDFVFSYEVFKVKENL